MEQRRVDDIGVADHPADIRRRPPHLARRDAVEILHRPLQRDHVAAIVAHHALGPAGGARRIENVERIGRRDRHAVERRARVDQRMIAHRRPVAVAAVDQFRFRLRALQDQAGVGLVLGEIDRLVEQRLIGDDTAGLDAAACREDHFRLGVVDPRRQFARGKTAEHHRVNGADARAGQHGEHRLRHHRHVENDPVALLHAEVAQHAAEHLGLGQQPVIGDGAFLPGERRVVDDRRLLAAPGIDMAVDGVEAGVADAADEPAAVDAGVRIEHGFGLFDPVDGGGRFAPKTLRIALPARVDFVIAARPGIHGCLLALPACRERRISHRILSAIASFASDATPPP